MLLWLRRHVVWRRLINRLLLARLLPLLGKLLLLLRGRGHRLVQLAAGLRGGHGGALLLLPLH